MSSQEGTTIFSLKFEDDGDEIELVPETVGGYQNEFFNSIVEQLPKVVEIKTEIKSEKETEIKTQTINDCVCPKCGKIYKYTALYQKHISTCEGLLSPTREALHRCSNCKKEYKNQLSYEKHVLFCDTKSAPCLLDKTRCFCCAEANPHMGTIKCVNCPKMFHTLQGVSRHMLLLHADTTKFSCELCNVQCPNTYILKLHRASHKDEIDLMDRNFPEYKCNVCAKCFLDKTALDIHVKNHRSRENIEPTISYNCKFCHLEYQSIEKFYGHLCERQTQKLRLKCEFCGRVLSSLGFYRRHINTHKKYNALSEETFVGLKEKTDNTSKHEIEDYELIDIDVSNDGASSGSADSRMDLQKKVLSALNVERKLEPAYSEPPQKVRILNGQVSGKPAPRILNPNAPSNMKPAQPIRILNGTTLTYNNNNNTKINEMHLVSEKMKPSTEPEEKDIETILKELTNEKINDDFFPMDDTTLRDSIISLLKVMLDSEQLEEFGLYTIPVEQVLSNVLKQLDFEPYNESEDSSVQIRENVKLLLKTMCDDKSAIDNIDNIYKVDIALRQLISSV